MNGMDDPGQAIYHSSLPGWGTGATESVVPENSVAGRWRNDAIGIITLVVAVLLVFAITNLGSRLDEVNAHFHTGRPGETVSTSSWSVTVDRVQVGTSFERQYGALSTTDQTYVLIHWHADVRHRVAAFSRVALVTKGGVAYQPRPEAINSNISKIEPGYTSHGASLFELPTGAEQGAVFQVGPQDQFITFFSSAVRIVGVLDVAEQESVLVGPAARTEVTP